MKYLFGIALLTLFACGPADEADPYQTLIDQGWGSYETADYASAVVSFSEAATLDPERPEAYSGLGWSYMRLDDLNLADGNFEAGSFKTGADADLWAGWAFALNALKSYANSNTQAAQAIASDATWIFAHQSTLTFQDLHVVKAENHFALGQFASSLSEVQILNASFTANVATPSGQSQLAAQIEQLKATYQKRIGS